jgi:hypothetical protein
MYIFGQEDSQWARVVLAQPRHVRYPVTGHPVKQHQFVDAAGCAVYRFGGVPCDLIGDVAEEFVIDAGFQCGVHAPASGIHQDLANDRRFNGKVG